MRRRGRHVRKPPDLTSLVDVMFILVFIALIRAATTETSAAPVAAPPPARPLPVVPVAPDVAALRDRALAMLRADLDHRTPLVIRISEAGTIEALELAGEKRPLDVPLLELSADPDAQIAYLGDRSAELRLCRIATVHLGLPDLASYLVIIAPAVPLADLKRALYRGLHEDLAHCLEEQRGLATIVDPANLPTRIAP